MATYKRLLQAIMVWAVLMVGGLLASCNSAVTVLGGNSGSSGQGGNTAVTGSTVTGATSGSGGSSNYSDCMWAGECEIVDRTCCGVCGIPDLADMTAINRQHHDAYIAGLCSEPGSEQCPECAQAQNASLFAYCDSSGGTLGQCVAADVRETEISQCQVDDDCRLRIGLECCEACAGGWNDLVAINVNFELELMNLVCPELLDIGCPECAPQYPDDTFASCNQGHCVVDGFDNGG